MAVEADFGFAQLLSEFSNVPGLIDLGPLPASIQNFTIYAVGQHTAAVEHLNAPDAATAIKKMGMEPG